MKKKNSLEKIWNLVEKQKVKISIEKIIFFLVQKSWNFIEKFFFFVDVKKVEISLNKKIYSVQK